MSTDVQTEPPPGRTRRDHRPPPTLLSSVGRVLLHIAREPTARVSDIAAAIDLSDRAVLMIIRRLEDDGAIRRQRVGRRNVYSVDPTYVPADLEPAGTDLGTWLRVLGVHPARAALGTRHGKAAQIAPALEPLGIEVEVEPIDTDAFGTFDGAVERRGRPADVAEAKARAAAASAGTRYGLASEGSFFADPAAPFLTIDLEHVAWVDVAAGLVVVGRHATPAPWAVPGVDLRADRCPQRRPNIAAAAADLARRLARHCDACGAPGVGVERRETGRPCAWCGGPTLEVARVVERCPGCGVESSTEVEGTADPGHCPACNP